MAREDGSADYSPSPSAIGSLSARLPPAPVLATRPRRRKSAAAASPAAQVGPDTLHDGDALADVEADSDYEHDESAVRAKRARDATDSNSFGDVASDSEYLPPKAACLSVLAVSINGGMRRHASACQWPAVFQRRSP